MAKQLKFGNGEWYGADGSILAYNDLNDNYKPLPFNFERGGSATVVNKEGLIEVVGGNQPRVDYKDSEDGVFLLEKAVTNLIPYSEDFSQWSGNGINITNNDVISPDGTLNADKVQSTDAYFGKYIQPSILSGNNYTASVFVKNATDENSITFRFLAGSNDCRYIFNIKELTVIPVIGYTNGFVSHNIENYGNGWYKCSLTVSSNGTSSVFVIYPKILTNSNTESANLWGAMLEQNSVASSYIPTQGTIQTRVQETASGSGNSGVFNDSQGVLYANIAANADDGVNKFISISDGTISNRINIVFDTSNNINARQAPGGVNISTSGVSILNSNKIAYEYQYGSQELWVNGFKIGETSVSTLPSGLDRLSFDSFNGGDNMYCKTKEIAYYNEISTDLELETLTSYRTWEAMVKELNLNIIHNE